MAIALLIVMMGLALIIDRIWLETAKLELMTAAEAAALGAAAELASDDLLVPNSSVDLRVSNALQTADWIASQNFVCGSPVTLNTEPEGDVLFGNLVQEPMGIQFLESSTNPNTVVVTTLRTRSNNNPIALFVTGATGLPYGDVAARVEASVNNDVVGLRSISGSPIPALPIAIWQVDPSGQRADTWNNLIESNQGSDNYSFDPDTHTVTAGPDGISEMVIHSAPTAGNQSNPNFQLVDIGTGLNNTELTRQIQSGLSVDDLQVWGGAIWLGQGVTLSLTCSPQFDSTQVTAFENLIGQRRVCFLYSTIAMQQSNGTSSQQSSAGTATCTEIVAIRILAVSQNADGSCSVTIQPTVMTTRTAILSSESTNPATDDATDLYTTDSFDAPTNSNGTSIGNFPSTTTTNAAPNRYVYKLRLTH